MGIVHQIGQLIFHCISGKREIDWCVVSRGCLSQQYRTQKQRKKINSNFHFSLNRLIFVILGQIYDFANIEHQIYFTIFCQISAFFLISSGNERWSGQLCAFSIIAGGKNSFCGGSCQFSTERKRF